MEGGLARHGPAVCTGQLPAHPRGFTSYQEALDFVNGLDVQALDPLPCEQKSIEKRERFPLPFLRVFLVTGLPALPAPKPCTRGPAG